jgi:predicted transcriptional regulator
MTGKDRIMTDTTRGAFSLRLPPELHHDLRLLRALTGQSANALIVRALQEYMEREGHEAITRGINDQLSGQVRRGVTSG